MLKLTIKVTKMKKDEWLLYVKQEVLCTAFSCARYCKAMQKKLLDFQ